MKSAEEILEEWEFLDREGCYSSLKNARLGLIKMAQDEQRRADAEIARNYYKTCSMTMLGGRYAKIGGWIANKIERGGEHGGEEEKSHNRTNRWPGRKLIGFMEPTTEAPKP